MFTIGNESRKTKLAILAFLLTYIALCLLSFWVHKDSALLGSFEKFDNDDVKYLRSAWTFLETGRYTYNYTDIDTVFIMPGITTLLAGFVAIFGKYPMLQFKIFQALLGAASLYMIFLIGRSIFSVRIGLIAAWIMCIYAPSIYITNIMLTESVFYFLFLLLFLFTVRALESGSWRYYIGGGIVLGLAVLFRPFIIAFPGVVFLMWLIKKYPISHMFKFGVAVIAIVCLIMFPWIVRNYILFDRFIPLTKASGNPALQGAFINYDQSVRQTENIDYYGIIQETTDIVLDLFGKDELVNDAVESQMVKIRFEQVMPKEPFRYIYWYTIGKSIKNWEKPFLWLPLYNVDYSFWTAQHYALLFCGLLGGILHMLSKSSSKIGWILPITVLFFNCAHLPYYCFARYMFPVMFCFALFTGYTIECIIKKVSFVNINLFPQIRRD